MTDAEALAAIRARRAAAGPAERWRMTQRGGRWDTPAAGLDDEYLGWDWPGGAPDVPPMPERGIFELGADAAFVHHAPGDIDLLLAMVDRLLAEKATRDAPQQSLTTRGFNWRRLLGR